MLYCECLRRYIMLYRLKFILKDLFVQPVVMFKKQMAFSLFPAIAVQLLKQDISISIATFGAAFCFALLVTMANDNYERQKQKTVDALKDE